jgi:hypothetical protein
MNYKNVEGIKNFIYENDRLVYEYEDGSVEVEYYTYDTKGYIDVLKSDKYNSKAEYEIAKLDEATAKRLGK